MTTELFNTRTLLNYALWYASFGYPVFPVRKNDKAPATPKGLHDATTDEKKIREWFTDGDYNIAIECSDTIVIDCDTYKDKSLVSWEKILDDENIPIQRTASGGRHFLFKRPEGVNWRNSANRIEPGIDTRTNGGYIVVAPSVIHGNEYVWLHDLKPKDELPEPAEWLRGKLDFKFSEIADHLPTPKPVPPEKRWGGESRASKYLAAMPESISGNGGHNALYAAATALVHGFELSVETALYLLTKEFNPRCQPPWSEKELRHKVEDAAAKQHDKPRGWLKNKEREFQQLDNEPEPDEQQDEDIAERHDFQKPPKELFDVPQILKEIMAFTEQNEIIAQPAFRLFGAIALLATLTSRRITTDGGSIRTGLYIVSLAVTCAGKDAARETNNAILSSLEKLARFNGPNDITSKNAIYRHLECSPACLLQTDEMGKLFMSANDKRNTATQGIVKTLLELYTSQKTKNYNPLAYADRKSNVTIHHPGMVIYGTSVPSNFFDSLSTQAVTDGLISRCLIVSGEKNIVYKNKRDRRTNKITPSEYITNIISAWAEFNGGDGNNGENEPEALDVPMTDEAWEILDKYTEKYITLDQDDEHRPLVARNGEKAKQLALVFAAAKHGPDREKLVIDEEAATWATLAVDWCTSNVLAACDRYMADNQFVKHQKGFIDYIERKTKASLLYVKKRDVDQRCREMKILQSRGFNELLETLILTRQIAIFDVKQQSGQYSKCYVLGKNIAKFRKKYPDSNEIKKL